MARDLPSKNVLFSRSLALPSVLALLLAGGAVSANASFQPVTCKNSFTPEQEVSEGRQVAAKVYQQMPVLPENDPVTRYVQQLGNRLIATAPRTPGLNQQWPFNFHVVASPDINAFALPGGSIFVNLGTIQAAETEAQLAGVMSHEMSHVIMRHSTCNIGQQKKKGLEYGLGAIGAAILLGNGTAGQLAQEGIGLGANIDMLHMSRGDEKQADLLGVTVLNNAGYDPRGLPQFFEIIQAKYGSGGAQFLSDHPNPGNRTEYVDQEIATLPPRNHPTVTSTAFVQAHAQAMREQTFTAEQVQSGAWRQSGRYPQGPGGATQASYPQQGQNGQYPQNGQQYPQNGQQYGQQYPQNGQQYPQNGQQYPQNGQQYPQNGQQYPQNGQQYPQNGQQYPQNGQQQGQQNGQYPQQGNGQGGVQGIAPLTRSQLGLRDRLVRLQAQRFAIQYPSSWQQAPNSNQDGTVTLAPRGASGSFGLAYGVQAGFQPQNGDGATDGGALQQASAALAQQFSQSSGLSQTGSPVMMRVAGQPAVGINLRGTSPVTSNSGQLAEHDWLVTVARQDGDLDYLVFVAPERDFATMKPVFNSILSHFQPQ